MFAERTRDGGSSHAVALPCGEAVTVSSSLQSRSSAFALGYTKTSSLARPSVYAAGATRNPGRVSGTVAAFRTTKPACSRRFSTLQRAQRPVGGQPLLL